MPFFPDFRRVPALLLCCAMLLEGALLQPMHVQPWPSWHSEVLAFAACLLLLLALLGRSSGQGRPFLRLPYVTFVWPILAICAMLQWAAGLIPLWGDVLVLFFYFFLAFGATVSGFDEGTRSNCKEGSIATYTPATVVLAWCLLATALVSVSVALVQATDVWLDVEWINRGASVRRPGANLGQPNQLATLLLMGVVSLLYLTGEKRLRGLSSGLAYLMLIVGLGLTESRTGLLGGALLLCFWLRYRGSLFAGIPMSFGLGGLVLLLVFFLSFPLLITLLQEGGFLNGSTPSANLSAGTRLVIWPQLLEAALQRPWLGWGLRQVSVAHNAVLDHYSLAEPFTYAHSIILDLVLGLGFPIALAILAVAVLWLVSRSTRVTDLTGWYGLALAMPLVVHSLLEYPFAYAYFLLPVLFGVGAAESRLGPTRYVSLHWMWLAAPAAVLAVLMGWSVVEYVEVEEDFRIARFEARSVGQTPADYQRPQIMLLTQMAVMLDASRLQPAPGMDVQHISLAREAALRFPWTALQNRYALTLALNGNPQEAIRQLKVMRAMHGEEHYQSIRATWLELANTRYPQLKGLDLP